MIDYDFSTLNDKEFENLSVDLISKDRDKRFERFKAGKDGGIDGRFYHDNGLQEIVQCKHYLKTGFSGLITSLNKKNDKGINEIEKVKNLNASNYIFVTSLPLSAENKKTIKELFDPYIKNDNDIYGREDLNQILGNHPDIEKKYYKLWLSSTVVLDRIINNAIESRSEFLLEHIKEKSKYYAVTENHQKAIDKLEESHIIIIAGEPGIGKTTLAEHLALWYIEQNFKFYDIENSINEAESIFKKDEKQLFYFDDFLGANYLNAIEDKKDSHIVKFMDRIKKDKTKRFILTSRTNIFNQGLALSDTFKSKNIENEEFIIKIESLKDIDKAHILYNHIWNSDLNEEFIDEIYVNKRYKEIIKHKNFNPRLIDFITDIKKIQLGQIEAKNYWDYVVDKLNNPQDVWQKAFDKDSDEFNRIIVILTVFNGNRIEEDKLRNSYNRYVELAGLTNNSHTSKDFDSVVKEVVKYFLNRNFKFYIEGREYIPFIHNKDEAIQIIEYNLFNPSIADYILNKYKNNQKVLIDIFKSLQTFKALATMVSLYFKDYMKHALYKEILGSIDYSENTNIDFLVKLIHMIYNEFEEGTLTENEKLNFENKIHSIMKIISMKKENIESSNVLLLIQTISYPDYKKNIEISVDLFYKIIESIDGEYQSDMRELIYFIENNQSLLDLKSKHLLEILQNKLEKYIVSNIESVSLKENSIKKIENIIRDDIKNQTDDLFQELVSNLGLNHDNLYFDKKRTNALKESLQNASIENIVDELGSKLFKEKFETQKYSMIEDGEKRDSAIDANIENDTKIDDLFQR
ncbi:restriction endonuclease [Sulfurospirillum diekertiae]|uniref:Restriction endonuclease n=1 Tax=Sulfurospirillum diekertiae TaxID=1854492 RepID=A0AA92FIA9_9BACT|nr:restriction endonuclease [Sulfurospirillum diekertiae]QIR76359.2 restriction endonuclease [Sulfurospirillum diekertiae]